jgi:hypothetical protein
MLSTTAEAGLSSNNQGKAINQGTYRQRRRQPARCFGSSSRGRRVRCVSGRNLLRVVTDLISLATDETKRQGKARQGKATGKAQLRPK